MRRARPPRRRARRAAVVLTAAAGLLVAGMTTPAHANGPEFGVTLGTNTFQQWPTRSVTLTATITSTLTGSGFTVFIVDATRGGVVAHCSTGTVCSGNTTEPTSGNDTYFAYISDSTGVPEFDPSFVVVIDWLGVFLQLNTQSGSDNQISGDTVVLNATSSRDILPSPFFLEIWDVSTGGPPALLRSCFTGTVCSTSVVQTTSSFSTHWYIATFGDDSSTYPPTRLQTTSGVTYVTWCDSEAPLSVTQGPTAANGQQTVIASSNIDLGRSDTNLEIFDEATGALLNVCQTGSTCTAAFTPAFGSGSHIVAFITATVIDTLPPIGVERSSNTFNLAQS